MHNKLFISDNAIRRDRQALYRRRLLPTSSQIEFGVSIPPSWTDGARLSKSFDSTERQTASVETLPSKQPSEAELETDRPRSPRTRQDGGTSYIQRFEADTSPRRSRTSRRSSGEGDAAYDTPDKARRGVATKPTPDGHRVAEEVERTQRDLIIVSPHSCPERARWL
jgi:hypothetical protein